MKILILGGDGFCGWPTTLELSAAGHSVIVVDNLARRNIDTELEAGSLTPIQPIGARIKAWKEVSNNEIGFRNIDVAKDFEKLLDLIEEERPDSIVHFAEQRAAPYSMKSADHKRYTVDNNLNATHNVCAAIVESGLDIHLVHLGTMGVYGYATADIALPEGYLPIRVKTKSGDWEDIEVVYPPNPGSIYHMTKTQDAMFFQFYAKNDGVRITDLHQGIVWGTQTTHTRRDPRLVNRFDYDGDFGTVLNRFLMQAAVGYPLTVHGTGGQTRAFINIQDTANCVRLAVESPPEAGARVRIMNQLTETHRVRDLAQMVSDATGAEIAYVDNPRKEAAENELEAHNDSLLKLGLQPIMLSTGLADEVVETAKKYAHLADHTKIPCVSTWTSRG
ncbi:MAG: NAD-dependent epimerase/dehydratase family protein [Paracoccaceae bacterium]